MAYVNLNIKSDNISLSEIKESALNNGFYCDITSINSIVIHSSDPTSLDLWKNQYENNENITMEFNEARFTSRIKGCRKITDESLLRTSAVAYFTMPQIRSIYNIPAPSATNVVVGVISFGGGLFGTVDSNGFLTNGDVQTYWSSIGITTQNQPKVIIKTINGATNTPSTNDNNFTLENTLDVEALGGACPTANMTIILYIVPNLLESFYTVLDYAINTPVIANNVSYKPTILSISWGAPEIYFPSQLLTNINTLLSTATANGMNIFAATGDYGSNNGVGGTGAFCDFPSSCPYLTAVGGTTLTSPNYIYDSSTTEIAWSSGGGGISIKFPKPTYQNALTVTGRSIPDIAAVADPNTGIVMILNNSTVIIGGTSVSAPIIAGFLATFKPTRFINPILYVANSNSFHDIVVGSNGAYSARIGYDECTGLGSINGVNLFIAITTILVSSVSVSPTTVTINSGQTTQLTTIVLPSNATNKTLSWLSSNSSVASVSSSGLVSGLTAGSTVITVVSTDGSNKTATCAVTVNILVSGITLNNSQINLQTTQTSQLVATIEPSNATNKTLSWSSSNSSVASVSSSGLVTGLTVGSTFITVASTDGSNRTATCAVTVIIPVSGITLNNSQINLQTTQTSQLVAAVEPSNATNKTLLWSSSNSSIASVSSSGLVTGLTVGSTVITVASTDGSNRTATCAVTVTLLIIPVSGITLNNSQINLQTTQTSQLVATVSPSNATNKTLSWSSSNSSIASVSSSGLVTGLTAGSTVITVVSTDGSNRTATCAVTVIIPVSGITLNISQRTLQLTQTYRLVATVTPSNATNRTLSWSSSNSSVAQVSSSGLVSGLTVGSAVITVVSTDGSNRTATATFTIIIPVSGITLNRSQINLQTTQTSQLVATVSPSNATNKTLLWSSSNSSIASVSSSGLVTGLTAGLTVITATSTDGSNRIALCGVTVTLLIIPVSGITLNNSQINLQTTQTSQLVATVSPSNATNKILSWSSSNSFVASVSSSGLVTGLTAGSTVIRVVSTDGSNRTATCTVTVTLLNIPVSGITLDVSQRTLQIAQIYQLVATVAPSNATNKRLSWSSSNSSVASVSNLGLVSGLTIGSAVITAVSTDGSNRTATATFTIIIPVSGITLNVSQRTLQPTQTYQLVATVVPSNATNRALSWSSSNSSVAQVSNSGLVSGLTVGSAIITAVSTDGSNRRATVNFTISIPVSGITLDISQRTLQVTQTYQLVATVAPSNATNKVLSWSSSNSSILSVSTSGLVTGLTAGSAFITVLSTDGSNRTATANFTITVVVSGIILNSNQITLQPLRAFQLLATVAPLNAINKSLSWSSSNSSIASVSSSGLITAQTVGFTIVTVSSTDGSNKTATCAVTVSSVPAVLVTGITLNNTQTTLLTSQTFQLQATVTPSNAANSALSWSSSNSAVASVSNSGLITALIAGITTITVVSRDGSNRSASCAITVNSAPISLISGITLNNTQIIVQTAQSFQLVETITPSNASNKKLSWTSSNPTVATVNSSGLVSTLTIGTSVITVSSTDGSNRIATCLIIVNISVLSITLDISQRTLQPSQTYQLISTVVPSNAPNRSLSWSTTNSSVATVSSTGLVRAIASGAVIIKASSTDGSNISASASFTVKIPVTGVSLNNSIVGLQPFQPYQLTPLIVPSNATNKSVIFTSSNAGIASINTSGVILAVAVGTAIITIRTVDGGFTTTATINIEVPVSRILLNTQSTTLSPGQTFQALVTIVPINATNTSVSWTSSNLAIATVSSSGLIRAIASGSSVITATSINGSRTASLTLTVK
jgi:uncharacterized protein YjdB